jgi:2-hydroxychromene-2-carboxylate isomerase
MATRKRTTVATAAASGDQRAALEALRDLLADQIGLADPAVVAQIAGQFRQTLKDLAALPPTREGSKLDEVKQRREARRAAAKAAPASGRGGRQ